MRPEASDMRLLMRCVTKLYEQCLENIRGEYGLSQIEIAIIGFLYNNPGKDTAAEMVELRRLPKGNVSQGVEAHWKIAFKSGAAHGCRADYQHALQHCRPYLYRTYS